MRSARTIAERESALGNPAFRRTCKLCCAAMARWNPNAYAVAISVAGAR